MNKAGEELNDIIRPWVFVSQVMCNTFLDLNMPLNLGSDSSWAIPVRVTVNQMRWGFSEGGESSCSSPVPHVMAGETETQEGPSFA